MTRIIYSPHYNMGLEGLERLHPFDVRKFGRAWELLRKRFGAKLVEWHLETDREVSREELLTVHSAEYLDTLGTSSLLARIFEVPMAKLVPAFLLDRGILSPMRWATRGTVLAAQAALTHGLAIHLGGGFHHAKRDRGEGFCVYSDVALAVATLRASGELKPDDQVVHVDLDAHMGNGVAHQFMHDSRVFLYDQFNSGVYPRSDHAAWVRLDHPVPLQPGCNGETYLEQLQHQLPSFLDSIQSKPVGLAIYNAGNDPFAGDQLGFLNVTEDEIVERDRFVVHELRKRDWPTVTLTSGGYSAESHRMIESACAEWLTM